jgi:glycosyltransferase involved in cell wall biosynthesis
VALVVTVLDLIPLRYRDQYFHGPLQRLLRARLELLRSADALLAISQATADDIVELLDVEPARVHVIDGGCSERFRPPEEPLERSMAVLRRAMPALRPGFLFFTANTDPRKNLRGTLRAYALLPPALREQHQLVMTCSQADAGFVTELHETIEELGLARDVLVTRYVTDEVLIRLFQRCELFLFPSYYEGLGLPLIEAMRCGAAAIASDTSSMREVVTDPRARFDPYSARSIADAIKRVLGDRALEAELRSSAAANVERYTWDHVARASIAGYEAAMARRWGEVA